MIGPLQCRQVCGCVSVIKTTECISDCGNDRLSADPGDERIEPLSCAPIDMQTTNENTPAARLMRALAAFVIHVGYSAPVMPTPALGQSR